MVYGSRARRHNLNNRLITKLLMIYLQHMKQSRGAAGYTIVEALIFMAVSGAMFLSALALISGRQGRAEFTSAARDFEVQIRDIANDVATGYYPNAATPGGYIRCQTPGGVITISFSATDNQGANDSCIFSGRTMHFNPSDGTGSEYRTYTMLGRRLVNGTTRDVENITQAGSVIVPETADTVPAPFFNIDCAFYATSSVTVAVQPCSTAGKVNVDSISFVTTFRPSDFVANGNATGDTQVNVLATANPSPLSKTTTALRTEIMGYSSGATAYVANPVGGIYLCLKSTGSNQHALIRLGGQGSVFATDMTINTGTCI